MIEIGCTFHRRHGATSGAEIVGRFGIIHHLGSDARVSSRIPTLRRRRNDPGEPHQPTEDVFEALVAAALKVDPKGLSGKYRKPKIEEPGDTPA